jgi:cytochrome b involved in lipid metabolism
MAQRFSKDDVAKHKSADDLYIIVDEDVYDLTKFADEHPGGKKSEPSRNSSHRLQSNIL